jgi:hypothetical protein
MTSDSRAWVRATPLPSTLLWNPNAGGVADPGTLQAHRPARGLHRPRLITVAITDRLCGALIAATAKELADLVLQRLLQDQPCFQPTDRLDRETANGHRPEPTATAQGGIFLPEHADGPEGTHVSAFELETCVGTADESSTHFIGMEQCPKPGVESKKRGGPGKEPTGKRRPPRQPGKKGKGKRKPEPRRPPGGKNPKGGYNPNENCNTDGLTNGGLICD